MATLPESWNDAEYLPGYDLVDKRELADIPFRIFGIYFKTNDQGVNFVYVEAERVDGTRFAFNDSSTGVRQQLAEYVAETNREAVIDTGERVPMNMVAPRGLRFSEFEVEVTNKVTQKAEMRKAKTFYLTRRGDVTETASPLPAKAATRTRKAS